MADNADTPRIPDSFSDHDEIPEVDTNGRLLIAVFLTDPGKSWTLRDLARRIPGNSESMYAGLAYLVHLRWLTETTNSDNTEFTLTEAGATQGRSVVAGTRSPAFLRLLEQSGIPLPGAGDAI